MCASFALLDHLNQFQFNQNFGIFRQLTLEFSSLGGAGALVHQALDVVGEDSAIAEDSVQIDIVVLVGVLGRGQGCLDGEGDGGGQDESEQQ